MKDASDSRASIDPSDAERRIVVGVMTGTSIDGLDAALVEILGRGLEMRVSLLRHVDFPLGALGVGLRSVAEQQPRSAGVLAKLAWSFGCLHADAIAALIEGQPAPDLVVAHGQTVFHEPPISWQLLNPLPIVQRLQCPVVSDLRQADLAAGGQGAPITPLADWILFRDAARPVAVVNLGGFCNITVLPADVRPTNEPPNAADRLAGVRGFDVCACNHVLDAVAARALDAPFDADGAAARAGTIDCAAADDLRECLDRQRRAGRSLGTGDEASAWISANAKKLMRDTRGPSNLAATAVEGVASCIGATLRTSLSLEGRLRTPTTLPPRTPVNDPIVVVAGGGARNRTLVEAIGRHASVAMVSSDDRGIPLAAREAVAMAVLGALAEDGVDITLPEVTGRGPAAALAGSWVRCGPHVRSK